MAAKWIAPVLLAGLTGCASVVADYGVNNKPDDLGRLASDVEAHDTETALMLYREAVEASGKSASAYVRLGDACLRAKKFTQAIEAYHQALDREPNDPNAQLGLGTALVQQGSLERGLAALIKAAPLVNTGAAYNRLGVAQTMAGRFPEAEATFLKGRKVAPDDLDIATNLALAAALAGDPETAASLANEIANSLDVKPIHRRNLVIVLGVIGKSMGDARAVAPADLSQSDLQALFTRAESIRRTTDPKARAHILGTMQG
jgi:Flp pilus assembly protein TadD